MAYNIIPEIDALCKQKGFPQVLQHAWVHYTERADTITIRYREGTDGVIMISAPHDSAKDITLTLYNLFAEEAVGRESRYGIAVTSPKEQKSVSLDWEAMRDFLLNADRVELLPDGTTVESYLNEDSSEPRRTIVNQLEGFVNAQMEK